MALSKAPRSGHRICPAINGEPLDSSIPPSSKKEVVEGPFRCRWRCSVVRTIAVVSVPLGRAPGESACAPVRIIDVMATRPAAGTGNHKAQRARGLSEGADRPAPYFLDKRPPTHTHARARPGRSSLAVAVQRWQDLLTLRHHRVRTALARLAFAAMRTAARIMPDWAAHFAESDFLSAHSKYSGGEREKAGTGHCGARLRAARAAVIP